jgi:hypothetical protein
MASYWDGPIILADHLGEIIFNSVKYSEIFRLYIIKYNIYITYIIWI